MTSFISEFSMTSFIVEFIMAFVIVVPFVLLIVALPLGFSSKFGVKDPKTGKIVDYTEILAKYPLDEAKKILDEWQNNKNDINSTECNEQNI